MIELFDLVSKQRKKSIKIKCNQVSYWRSESEKINKFIQYIEDNIDKFYVELFDIKYDTMLDEKYVKSFDIILYTNQETYDYISDRYNFLLDKYDKYIINLSDVKFFSLSADGLRL